MADVGAAAIEAAIVWAAWPGMLAVSTFALYRTWRFYRLVNRSPFGQLVLLMVVAWVGTMAGMGYVGTIYVLTAPGVDPAIAALLLTIWAGSMVLIVWVVHRWGEEAVSINMYYLELKNLDATKSQLINTVAHELNTPLTPVRLKLELLGSEALGPLNEKQKSTVTGLDRSIRRLSTLIEQVVLATQVQSQHLKLNRVPVDVDALVRRVAGACVPIAKEKGIDLEVQAASGRVLPLDLSRLDRVLASLLSNAVKFNRPGGHVSVSARSWGEGAAIEVRDDGAGIDSADLPKLFQPFRQAHDAMQRSDSGAGLDLYIAQGIIGAHGGRVLVESAGLGMGTTFRIILPDSGAGQDPVPAAH